MITIVFGTRAELIKIFPIIKELGERKIKYSIIHTGQHNINDLLKELKIRKPDFQIDISNKKAGRFKNILQAIIWTI